MKVFRILAASLIVALASAASAQVANPDFDAVASRLDSGGSFYLYIDTGDFCEELISAFEPILMQTGAPEAAMVSQLARTAVDVLGINDLDDIGMSYARMDDEISRQKFFLRLRERKGLFGLFGSAPRDLAGLAFCPGDSVVAVAQNFNFADVKTFADEAALSLGGAAAAGAIAAALAQANAMTGLDVERLISLLGDEIAAYMRLDKTQIVEFPIDNNLTLSVPRPSFALLLGVKDRSLFDAAVKLMTDAAPLAKEQIVDGVDSYVLQAPPNPFGLRPVMASLEGWVVVASDPAELQKALATAKGGGDVRGSEGYRRLSAGMPAQCNGVNYISPRLGEEVAKAISELMANESIGGMGADATPLLLTQMIGASQKSAGALGMRINHPDGMQCIIQGSSSGMQSFQAMLAPFAGVAGAVAIPGFVKARETSQMRACQENLAKLDGAKEQWALENNEGMGSEPTFEDLIGPTLYIRRMPICYSGGEYTLNKVGEDPTCSLESEGHYLQW